MTPWEMKNLLWPLLAEGLMAKGRFPLATQSEQLLEDYKALDLLVLILNVISAGQFLQMRPSPSPARPVLPTTTQHSTPSGLGPDQGL